VSLTVTATTAPVIIAPAMNTVMWNHAAVQRNVQRLCEEGISIIESTFIFSAAELVYYGMPMYSGLGTFTHVARRNPPYLCWWFSHVRVSSRSPP
jgi:hypothetical protein